jgi:hypothetical protein
MYASSGRSLTAWQSNASGYKISNKYISHDFVFRIEHKIVFLAFCFIYFSIFWLVCREICFISKCIRASNVSSRHITRGSCDPLLNLEYRYLLHSTNVSLISSLFCCHLCFIRPRVIWRLETLEARIHFEIKHISRHTSQKIEKYIKQKARKTMTKFTLLDRGTF